MTLKSQTFGEELRNQRLIRRLSLRQAEDAIKKFTGGVKISNAYISQLENDVVTNPTVKILSILSQFYKVDFNYLVELINPEISTNSKRQSRSTFAITMNEVSRQEQRELIQYLGFMRSR